MKIEMKRSDIPLVVVVVLILLLLLVSGCSRKVVPSTTITENTKTEKTDSSWSDPVKKKSDTTKVAGKTITVVRYIHCDSNNHVVPVKAIEKKGNAELDIDLDKDGKMTSTLKCDSLERVVENQSQLIHHLQKEKTVTTKTVERRIPVVTTVSYGYDKYFARPLSVIVILIGAGWALKTYSKFQIPFT